MGGGSQPVKTAGYVLLLILTLQAAAPRTANASLVITEVMYKSVHDNSATDGDWWELSNTDSFSADLTGHYWKNLSTTGDNCYFNGITIAAGESIIILNESDPQKAELWKSDWNLPAQTNVYDRSYFNDTFPDLGETDGVQLYNADDDRIASARYIGSEDGFSQAWNLNEIPLGASVNGVNGAYQSTNSSPDVASPGIAVPEPTSAITLLVLSIIATTRQKSSNTLKFRFSI